MRGDTGWEWGEGGAMGMITCLSAKSDVPDSFSSAAPNLPRGRARG